MSAGDEDKRLRRLAEELTISSRYFCDNEARYSVVQEAAIASGLHITKSTDKSKTIYWHDSGALGVDVLSKLSGVQKINHFPGMSQICNKSRLARTLQRIKVHLPQSFKFHPSTWCLPEDKYSLMKFYHTKRAHPNIYIVKPSSGCQGNGIFLTRDLSIIENDLSGVFNSHVVQLYLDRPMLINNFKFDLRVYVLVSAVYPHLRAFVHEEGLVRFCTEHYKKSKRLENQFIHLTNYAVNRKSESFVQPSMEAKGKFTGSKWTVSQFFEYLKENAESLGEINTEKLWSSIKHIITKTLLSVQYNVNQEYIAWFRKRKLEGGFSCFEVLGFDIFIDSSGKPWLLEVNSSPSFHTESSLDYNVKFSVLRDAFNLAGIFSDDVLDSSRCPSLDQVEKQERLQRIRTYYEDSHLGGFQRIYPVEKENRLSICQSRVLEMFGRLEVYHQILEFQHPLFRERSRVAKFKLELEKKRRNRNKERILRGNRPEWNCSVKLSKEKRIENDESRPKPFIPREKEKEFFERLSQGKPSHASFKWRSKQVPRLTLRPHSSSGSSNEEIKPIASKPLELNLPFKLDLTPIKKAFSGNSRMKPCSKSRETALSASHTKNTSRKEKQAKQQETSSLPSGDRIVRRINLRKQ